MSRTNAKTIDALIERAKYRKEINASRPAVSPIPTSLWTEAQNSQLDLQSFQELNEMAKTIDAGIVKAEMECSEETKERVTKVENLVCNFLTHDTIDVSKS